MVIGKIKPTATIVAQFAAGVEVEAIQHEGKMYLPVVGMGEFATADPTPTKPATKKDEPAVTEAAPSAAPKATTSTKKYTKDELMETDSKELIKILKNEFGINPDDFDGKNTNKKLRDLILDAQKNGGAKPAPAEEEEETEEAEDDSKDGGDTDEVVDQIADLLEDFDAGKKNKKKTIAAICALSEDSDTDKVTELVEEFEDDAEADIDEMAQKIADSFAPKKPSKKEKKSKRGKKEEDLVSVSDLEVGDRVSVWWDDDNQEWFDGEVKSIKKGKVVIAYDDDTEEPIDPEVHTKIKKLAE